MKDYVRFLKPININVNRPYLCGDGCCTYNNWHTTAVDEQEVIQYENVDVSDLKEGEDFVYED